MPRPTLDANQQFAQNWLLSHPHCGLFLDVGMGKTLTVLDSLFRLNPRGHVLVIAPKNIARTTWIDELKKWQLPLRHKSLLVDEKGRDLKPDARHQLYAETISSPPTLYFINKEKLQDLVANLPRWKGKRIWPFSIVIIDESQGFKSYKSERFKALMDILPNIDRVILLTGTPMPKSLMDLWSQIYLLDKGRRLGKNITAYRNKYFYPGRVIDNYPIEWIPRPGAEDAIFRAIGDLVISMRNTNLKLPAITFTELQYYMLPDERKKYKTLMKKFVLELAPDVIVEAKNSGTLFGKLHQMAGGALYRDDGNNEGGVPSYEVIHKGKLELVDYCIHNTYGNVIIAYHFKSDMDMLMKHLTKQGIQAKVLDGKPETVHAWNRGEIPVLLLQPASCGHGLNLQDGGSTLIFYSLPTSFEEYEQTIGRIHRKGQTKPVTIIKLLTAYTVDDRIVQLTKTKDMNQNRLKDSIQAQVPPALNIPQIVKDTIRQDIEEY